jgi:hypothetical protein
MFESCNIFFLLMINMLQNYVQHSTYLPKCKKKKRKECKKEIIKRQSLCVYRSNHTHAHLYNMCVCVCVRVCVCVCARARIQKVKAHIG